MPREVCRVPMVMQMESLECGAACLAMILAYYGRWMPLEEVRTACGVSRDGSKVADIVKAARSYGLEVDAFKSTTESIRQEGLFPCMAYWNFNHFVVVEGFRGKKAFVCDPSRGEIKIPINEFDECFTGVTLEFRKTDAFLEGGSRRGIADFVRHRLRRLGRMVAFVSAAVGVVSFVSIANIGLGQVFVDRILSGVNPEWLVPLALTMALFIAIATAGTMINDVYFMRIQAKLAVVSSLRFMRHLLHLPMRFYSQRMVGDLQQRQASNETVAATLVGELAPAIINFFMMVIYLVVMLQYSPLLTVAGLVCICINVLVAFNLMWKRANLSRALAANAGKRESATLGGIEIIESIKAAGAEVGFFGLWSRRHVAAVNDMSRAQYLNAFIGHVPAILRDITNAIVLALGIWLIVRGDLTEGSLLAFTGLISIFMDPINHFVQSAQTIQDMRTQVERIEDVMGYEADVPEEPDDAQMATTLNGREKLRGEVDLKGVSFGYAPFDKPLIKDFDLHVDPGAWVALVGGSGSGKSTLAKLICGLYKPWSGQVSFDGTALDDVPLPVLRGSLAVVDQDVVTFADTVAQNVRLWDKSIEGYDIVLACRDACIHDVIVSRTGGYDCLVLPDGQNFSGGQLQRMEIARALAQEPSILILDEATSALDAQIEDEIIRRIRDRGITCIVIAHRLSTIRSCDEIVVLDGGRVLERGTHDELLDKNGRYAALVRSD